MSIETINGSPTVDSVMLSIPGIGDITFKDVHEFVEANIDIKTGNVPQTKRGCALLVFSLLYLSGFSFFGLYQNGMKQATSMPDGVIEAITAMFINGFNASLAGRETGDE